MEVKVKNDGNHKVSMDYMNKDSRNMDFSILLYCISDRIDMII